MSMLRAVSNCTENGAKSNLSADECCSLSIQRYFEDPPLLFISIGFLFYSELYEII